MSDTPQTFTVEAAGQPENCEEIRLQVYPDYIGLHQGYGQDAHHVGMTPIQVKAIIQALLQSGIINISDI